MQGHAAVLGKTAPRGTFAASLKRGGLAAICGVALAVAGAVQIAGIVTRPHNLENSIRDLHAKYYDKHALPYDFTEIESFIGVIGKTDLSTLSTESRRAIPDILATYLIEKSERRDRLWNEALDLSRAVTDATLSNGVADGAAWLRMADTACFASDMTKCQGALGMSYITTPARMTIAYERFQLAISQRGRSSLDLDFWIAGDVRTMLLSPWWMDYLTWMARCALRWPDQASFIASLVDHVRPNAVETYNSAIAWVKTKGAEK